MRSLNSISSIDPDQVPPVQAVQPARQRDGEPDPPLRPGTLDTRPSFQRILHLIAPACTPEFQATFSAEHAAGPAST